jgi:hypothetical protein
LRTTQPAILIFRPPRHKEEIGLLIPIYDREKGVKGGFQKHPQLLARQDAEAQFDLLEAEKADANGIQDETTTAGWACIRAADRSIPELGIADLPAIGSVRIASAAL